MERLGKKIQSKFCNKMKGSLDDNIVYSTNDLINAIRNNPECKLEEVIHWLFGGADWVGDTEKEKYVTNKILEFINNNPSPHDEYLKIISCVSEKCRNRFYVAYCVHKTDEEKEIYKNALLDLFIT